MRYRVARLAVRWIASDVAALSSLRKDVVTMTTPMQPDPLDAPDWLVTLLRKHDDWLNSEDGSSAICDCGAMVSTSDAWTDCDDAHRAHVAAVVWAAITERINEAQANSDGYGPFFDAPYLIERLGGFPDELEAE